MRTVVSRPDKIYIHETDLPEWVMQEIAKLERKEVAIDTEAMGLCLERDRLCLVQLSTNGKDCHLIKYNANSTYISENLTTLLEDESVTKIFHFARFDVALLFKTFGILAKNIYCTKIASKLARTYTERHGLKTICRELLGVEISKTEQLSDWGKKNLSDEQRIYAATDVLYLHALKDILNEMLIRELRMEVAQKCFEFLPYLSQLDCLGWSESLFAHL